MNLRERMRLSICFQTQLATYSEDVYAAQWLYWIWCPLSLCKHMKAMLSFLSVRRSHGRVEKKASDGWISWRIARTAWSLCVTKTMRVIGMHLLIVFKQCCQSWLSRDQYLLLFLTGSRHKSLLWKERHIIMLHAIQIVLTNFRIRLSLIRSSRYHDS